MFRLSGKSVGAFQKISIGQGDKNGYNAAICTSVVYCFTVDLFSRGVRRTTPKGDVMYDLEKKINDAVFPGLQGGPHDNVIAGLKHLM